jgi:intergrase/recombinase
MCKSEIQKVDTKRKFVYNKLVDVGVKSPRL